jgi:hypothetical protein
MLCMIEIARAAEVSTVIATMMAVDVVSRRLMEKAGLHLVQTLVSETRGPTAAAARGEVEYALDLTMEASCRHSVLSAAWVRRDVTRWSSVAPRSSALTRVLLRAHLEHVESAQLYRGAYAPKRADE